MTDDENANVLSRSSDEVRRMAAEESRTLRRALSIENWSRCFRLHHGLVTSSSTTATVCLENLLADLTRCCSMQMLASEYPQSLEMVLTSASALAKAALYCVASAYASTAQHSGDLEDRLNAIVPYLPLCVDRKLFTDPFSNLAECCRRRDNGAVLDFSVVLSALQSLKEACDASGELLAAVSPMSAMTWDCNHTNFYWPGRSCSFSLTPPDTPDLNSPVHNRQKANSLPSRSTDAAMAMGDSHAISLPPGKKSVKMAFESVSMPNNPPGSAFDFLSSGFMTALNDELSTSTGTFSSDDGSEGSSSSGHHYCQRYQSLSGYGVKNDPFVYTDGCWNRSAPRTESYMTRQEKGNLQWKERPVGFRVVMCRHMDAKGKCKKAGTCTFAHSQDDLELFRSLFIPTERCNYGGRCLYRNKDCQYSHTPSEQHRSIRNYNVAVSRACANSATC